VKGKEKQKEKEKRWLVWRCSLVRGKEKQKEKERWLVWGAKNGCHCLVREKDPEQKRKRSLQL
jgi:hypothetical protein